MNVNELNVNELNVNELNVNELNVNELNVNELNVNELNVNELNVNELNVNELNINELNEKVIKEINGNYTFFELLNPYFIQQLDVYPIHTYCIYPQVNNNSSSGSYLPINFNIKNHLNRIICYFKKDYLYNNIIIGKLIEYDIFFYIVQNVDYEHFPQHTSRLFYTYSLQELVSYFINYDTKIEILNLLRLNKNEYTQQDNLEDLFDGLNINEMR